MSTARARLAALAAAAGYGPDDARADRRCRRCPRYRPGDRLDDAAVAQVVHGRRGARPVPATPPTRSRTLVADYRERYGERCWREHVLARTSCASPRCAPTTRASTASRRARPTRPARRAGAPVAAPARTLPPPAEGGHHDHPRRDGRAPPRPPPPTSARPSWPRGSRSRAGCPSATTASRCATSRTPPTPRSCSARTTGAGTTSRASARRRAPRCSSAAASTTRSPPTTASSSSTARRSRSTSSTTPTATTGRASSPPNRPSAASRWDAELDEPRAFAVGPRGARRSRCAELVPLIGRPVAVQRELEYALAPGLEWTIQGFLDLETLRERPTDGGEPVAGDRRLQGQEHACTRRPRPTTTRRPASTSPAAGSPATPRSEFCFAQIGKPGSAAQADEHEPSSPPAARTGQLRATLARIAQAASQIAASTSATGPTSRGGSPTRAAGSARRATAPTTRAARAAAGCSGQGRAADSWGAFREASKTVPFVTTRSVDLRCW